MKVVFILAAVAVAANLLFIWYAKKKRHKTKTNDSYFKYGSIADSKEFWDSEKGKKLKQSAAAELSISVEELDRMSVEEITQLAKEKKLI